jgi:hypothetical protein
MELLLIVIATFMAGALVGFGISTVLNVGTMNELHEECERLKDENRKKAYIKPQIIEISDPGAANGIEFPGATKIK